MPENQINKLKLKKEEIEFQKEVDKYIPTIEGFFSEIVDISKWEEFSTIGAIPDIPKFKRIYDPSKKHIPSKKYICETIYDDSLSWNSKEKAILVWLGILMYHLLKKRVIGNSKPFKYAWRVKPESYITVDFETMQKYYKVRSRSLFWSLDGK